MTLLSIRLSFPFYSQDADRGAHRVAPCGEARLTIIVLLHTREPAAADTECT